MIERSKLDLIHRLALLGQQNALRRAIGEMTAAERCDLVGWITFGRDGSSLPDHLARSHRHSDHSPSFVCEMAVADNLNTALKRTSRRRREAPLADPAA